MKSFDYIRSTHPEAIRRNIVQPVSIQKRESVVEGEPAKEIIRGYFSIYNSDYRIWPGYIERIAPGFFDGIDMTDVLCLYNHDDDRLLGRQVDGEGTLKISFDTKGGFFEVEKSNTTTANDVYEDIKLKNIRGCSFAFSVAEQSVEYDVPQSDGSTATVVTLIRGKVLYDVGPVTNPAYTETEVEAAQRSLKATQPPINRELQLLNLKLNTKK